MKTPRKRRRASRTTVTLPKTFRYMIAANACTALRDASYAVTRRAVDEMMKDPELREEIDYYARQIIKAILRKL